MIIFDNPIYANRIAEAAGTIYNPFADRSIVRVEGEDLIGGVLYQGYTGASIQIHMAGFAPTWVTRDLMWVVFDYPFRQLGCETLFGQVPEANTKALEIDLKLGFKIVAKIEGVYPDGACIVVAMKRDECRWLNMKPRALALSKES
jgi:RimJ/RimL family protein N-acetyltransferase